MIGLMITKRDATLCARTIGSGQISRASVFCFSLSSITATQRGASCSPPLFAHCLPRLLRLPLNYRLEIIASEYTTPPPLFFFFFNRLWSRSRPPAQDTSGRIASPPAIPFSLFPRISASLFPPCPRQRRSTATARRWYYALYIHFLVLLLDIHTNNNFLTIFLIRRHRVLTKPLLCYPRSVKNQSSLSQGTLLELILSFGCPRS